jgi:hypothetical protein
MALLLQGIEYRAVADSIYYLFIILCCTVIYLRTKRLYDLSQYEGLRYFKSAFLYYGLGYGASYLLQMSFYFQKELYYILSMPMAAVTGYLLSMGGFFLVYSLIWKGFGSGTRIMFLHASSAIIGLLNAASGSPTVLYLTQMAVFAYASLISFQNYAQSRKKIFPQLFFITTVLLLVAWIMNFAYQVLYFVFPDFYIYVQIVTMVIFTIFLYLVLSLTRNGKEKRAA